MQYTIELHKRVERFFSRHPQIGRQFFLKTKVMKNNPFDSSLDIVMIDTWWRRLRIGWYRFVFTINANQKIIFFIEADNRWDSYKTQSKNRWGSINT
jgi:mRNA-degrading endonuclease RelE of RelBE toxin-antitoxin system